MANMPLRKVTDRYAKEVRCKALMPGVQMKTPSDLRQRASIQMIAASNQAIAFVHIRRLPFPKSNESSVTRWG